MDSLTKLCVDEGSVVKKGQTLFVIDPVQYEEAVNVARAVVKVAEAGSRQPLLPQRIKKCWRRKHYQPIRTTNGREHSGSTKG